MALVLILALMLLLQLKVVTHLEEAAAFLSILLKSLRE